jgi:hypothetical protein
LASTWASIFSAQPEIIVQNVTGAGSVIAANQVYNVAKAEELEALVKEIFDSPPEVVERVKKILANQAGSEIR